MTFDQISKQIQQGKYAPIYYLHGPEGYFIDKLVNALDAEGAVLQSGEASFNREVFFGPDTTASKVLNACRSFPMMAQRRLIILKEAHRMNKDEVKKLVSYLKDPVASTVFVMVFKDPRVGVPKAGVEAIKTKGIDFHAKKMYERDVNRWLQGFIQQSGFEADGSIPGILTTNLGTNLNLIENELDKMFIYLKATKQTALKQDFVYQMINVDKQFNVFELVHALGGRQRYKAHMIIDRLTQNAKINPPVLIVGNLFRFFHMVALVHRHQLRDVNAIKNKLGVNYYQAQDYAAAARNYNRAQVYRNIGHIEQVDLSIKGQMPTNLSARHLLKTLVWQLLN